MGWSEIEVKANWKYRLVNLLILISFTFARNQEKCMLQNKVTGNRYQNHIGGQKSYNLKTHTQQVVPFRSWIDAQEHVSQWSFKSNFLQKPQTRAFAVTSSYIELLFMPIFFAWHLIWKIFRHKTWTSYLLHALCPYLEWTPLIYSLIFVHIF
jgi:hypothetical protein